MTTLHRRPVHLGENPREKLRETPARRPQRRPQPLAETRDPAAILRSQIAHISAEVDKRLGNKPGTCHRAVYFWLWPPQDNTSIPVLENLRTDAVVWLLAAMEKNFNNNQGDAP